MNDRHSRPWCKAGAAGVACGPTFARATCASSSSTHALKGAHGCSAGGVFRIEHSVGVLDGAATYYRGIVRELHAHGTDVTFYEPEAAGHSPSVRLFEAAACGQPIISDEWAGLDTFFEPGKEFLVTRSAEETLSYLRELPAAERIAIAARARKRVLASHTAAHRAQQFEESVRN